MAATGTASTAQQRRSISWLGPGPVLHRAALAFVLISIHLVATKQLQPRIDETRQDDNGICKSMDIRNTLDTFKRLEGCRVVEGFVQILLFDNVNESELANITFPELVEITDYLLLYRVNGLQTLGKLFPNLAVIRGQNTFFSHSLVIFEMSSLQEIGLYSLTDITHGLIRIDKNPSLCFVNSIDWDRIAADKGHFIQSLKPTNECPVCPGEDEKENGLAACPKASIKSDSISTGRDKYLCWNRQHCQKICKMPNCRYCNRHGDCCSDTCLGGCSDYDVKVCTVCRNLTMGFDSDRQCMSSCPNNYYQYLDRRCVSHQLCMSMVKPIDLHSTNEDDFPYKIYGGKCILHCPTDYMSDTSVSGNRTCKPCEGRCKKDCPGMNIDSINLAKELRGCTNITGSLEIQLRGGRNVVNELEDNLSMIEEITGYLKVVRSFPLVSLNFLKNLKRIRGSYLESQKFSLVVLDNQNLLDLWDWGTNRTFAIDGGRLFFHFNPKLCLNKIEELQKVASLSNFTDLEVAPNSNGDKIACDVTNLEVEITRRTSKGVILKWKQFKMHDERKLLGYVVYSIETKHRNVTWYDGRDACGGDGWRVDDVAVPDPADNDVSHPLLSLKPYTQYAYYVKTYTIATERSGAQSKIDYFTTQSSVPSLPLALKIPSYTFSSFNISWDPPKYPNGNITYYIVSGKKRPVNALDESSEKEQCNYSPQSRPTEGSSSNRPVEKPTTSTETCDCDEKKTGSKSTINEGEQESRINFEDYLQNEVYVKKVVNRRKREAAGEAFPTDIPHIKDNNNLLGYKNIKDNATGTWVSFTFNVTGKNEFFIDNLHHATEYEIDVQACRALEGPDDKEGSCSKESIIHQRTKIKVDADRIEDIVVSNNGSGMVTLTWKVPEDPNGVIYGYIIEYKRLDNENSINTECIAHSAFLRKNRVYPVEKNLLPGNYSLRVKALTYDKRNKVYSKEVYFYIDASSSSNTVLYVILGLALPVSVLITLYVCYKKQKSDNDSLRLIPSVNPEYVPSVYVPDEWEVPRRNIELIQELGQGSFGMVYEGLASDIKGKSQIKCAVKTVNEHATNRERLEFLNEASVMKAFDTTHVVRLLGVVSQGQPTLVIMELMANGDLKTYLRMHRPEMEPLDSSEVRSPPTLKQILKMAIEIADGMAYLSAKKFVHRDLAARNCMVAEDLTVKIGDFGMTRDIYETDYYRKGTKGLLPVRWMAPESLKDGVFTSNSDVWSYGVVLWEMATLASQPYQGLSNDQVLRYVIDGGVMERPENCPDKLYELMRDCWEHKPSSRPTFLQLCSLLYEDACANFPQVSFYDSPAGQEARASRPTPSTSQDDPSTPLRMTEDLDHNFSINSDDSETEEYRDDMEPSLSFGVSVEVADKRPPIVKFFKKHRVH